MSLLSLFKLFLYNKIYIFVFFFLFKAAIE